MTFIEIATALDKALGNTQTQKSALDAARKVVADAEVAYATAVSDVKALHNQYSVLMQDVLSLGGTLHR